MRPVSSTLVLLALSAATLLAQDKPKVIEYWNPAWSPDGRTLVFESTRDGKYAVYTIGADGTGLKRLTSPDVNSEQPGWSPDGTRILFSSDRDGKHLDLYLMDADGSNPVRLTTTPAGGYYQSAFSPDGKWIAFQGRPDNARVDDHIYVIRADGSRWRQLTDSTTNSMSPAWSPDGRWITFEQQPVTKRLWKEMDKEAMAGMRSGQRLLAIGPGGSGLRPLLPGQTRPCCARWSRDGRTLYFATGVGDSAVVWAASVDGSGARRLGYKTVLGGMEISPDGRYVAYTKEVDKLAGVYVREIATGVERLIAGGAAR
jgi:Tol biopolymer transport system component